MSKIVGYLLPLGSPQVWGAWGLKLCSNPVSCSKWLHLYVLGSSPAQWEPWCHRLPWLEVKRRQDDALHVAWLTSTQPKLALLFLDQHLVPVDIIAKGNLGPSLTAQLMPRIGGWEGALPPSLPLYLNSPLLSRGFHICRSRPCSDSFGNQGILWEGRTDPRCLTREKGTLGSLHDQVGKTGAVCQ